MKLVKLVSLNKVQPVLSQICDYSPLSVKKLCTYGGNHTKRGHSMTL